MEIEPNISSLTRIDLNEYFNSTRAKIIRQRTHFPDYTEEARLDFVLNPFNANVNVLFFNDFNLANRKIKIDSPFDTNFLDSLKDSQINPNLGIFVVVKNIPSAMAKTLNLKIDCGGTIYQAAPFVVKNEKNETSVIFSNVIRQDGQEFDTLLIEDSDEQIGKINFEFYLKNLN